MSEQDCKLYIAYRWEDDSDDVKLLSISPYTSDRAFGEFRVLEGIKPTTNVTDQILPNILGQKVTVLFGWHTEYDSDQDREDLMSAADLGGFCYTIREIGFVFYDCVKETYGLLLSPKGVNMSQYLQTPVDDIDTVINFVEI